MTNYPLENLNDEEFETLVIRICNELLGIGCKTFSVGKDGAKDSWFDGKAEKYPSSQDSWSGKFIIQAKHTQNTEASCSDNEFSVNQTSIINQEIKRLNEIKQITPFDNYIIFTNRKLSGLAHPVIVQKIKDGINLINAELIGKEDINAYLDAYPHIADKFGLYRFAYPLRFYEKDLQEVITVFAQHLSTIAKATTEYIVTFDSIQKEEKNQINNLSADYFEFIKSHSLQYFEKIDDFLKDPKNIIYTKYYSNTVSDLQAKIIIERTRFNDFMYLIEHLVDFVVFNNQERLKDLRDIVRVFVHFMYFNCDIGKTR